MNMQRIRLAVAALVTPFVCCGAEYPSEASEEPETATASQAVSNLSVVNAWPHPNYEGRGVGLAAPPCDDAMAPELSLRFAQGTEFYGTSSIAQGNDCMFRICREIDSHNECTDCSEWSWGAIPDLNFWQGGGFNDRVRCIQVT